MDYRLEELGDERFQYLCQSLLSNEFPDVQCFPVGQPDGGRDATRRIRIYRADGPLQVFQVKFSRKPMAVTDSHAWLLDQLKTELPKIKALIPNKASKYFLLTNVPGTAHPGTGSIDKMQNILSAELPLPVQCWWRDDINRRLDNNYDLKWAFPEILSGPDILRSIIEQGLSDHGERRTAAVRTFVRSQFESDRDVRFKQVELQNNLLDLYVDVPLVERDAHSGLASEHLWATDNDRQVRGAAELLLDPVFVRHKPLLVIEGAPGQGKSTLGQYLCQVHRLHILRESGLESVPQQHKPRAVKLPVRVDLRDLATWLSGRNPLAADESAKPPNWHPSLESYLAFLVSALSGGAEFSVADLHAVAKLSALLLVCDGLDEVADLSARQTIIDQITAGVHRLRELTADLQVVVTSRPSVMTSEARLSDRLFGYYHLQSLSKHLIFEYCDKWLSARHVDQQDAAAVRRVLRERIEQPHLRELSRNSMQLAILLSLIYTRGTSLPDKRTALYSGYVELFFNREAEKSAAVRSHRDLLLQLHGYFAWVVHTGSEEGKHSGSVSGDQLRALVRNYLQTEERDPGVADQLFTGTVERVMFLVSRLEGSYEFEVQPLREYFVARHLYETAPYSPTGQERRGTKPDRFDAIVANSYWENVTRFYAGFYSKGELPSLIQRLQALSEGDTHKYTGLAQRMAVILLGDWVFSQDQRCTKGAVELVAAGGVLPHVYNRRRYAGGAYDNDELALPEGCGRGELAERCWDVIRQETRSDRMEEAAALLVANARGGDVDDRWRGWRSEGGREGLLRWMRCGLQIGTLSRLKEDEVDGAIQGVEETGEVQRLLLDAGKYQYLEATEERAQRVLNEVLEAATWRPQSAREGWIGAVAWLMSPVRYTLALETAAPMALTEVVARYRGPGLGERLSPEKLPYAANAVTRRCAAFVGVAAEVGGIGADQWARALGPWEVLVRAATEQFGPKARVLQLANCAAGIRSAQEKGLAGSDLFDWSAPLCERCRHARMKAGVAKWWQEHVERARSAVDRLLLAIVAASWAGASVIEGEAGVREVIDGLSQGEFLTVAVSTKLTGASRSRLRIGSAKKLSPRMATLVSLRATVPDAVRFYAESVAGKKLGDPVLLNFAAFGALAGALEEFIAWDEALRCVEAAYKGDAPELFEVAELMRSRAMSAPVARKILEMRERLPRWLAQNAEGHMWELAERRRRAVGSVAEKERWFLRPK